MCALSRCTLSRLARLRLEALSPTFNVIRFTRKPEKTMVGTFTFKFNKMRSLLDDLVQIDCQVEMYMSVTKYAAQSFICM
jgi:hypothetical protein